MFFSLLATVPDMYGLQHSYPFISPAGLTLGAEMYLSGQHHGETMLYHKGTFPYGAITKVQFLWQCLTLTDPSKDESTSAAPSADRKLWMWVHPSAFSEVLDAIKVIVESGKFANSK